MWPISPAIPSEPRQNFSVDDDAAADAGAECEQDEIVDVAARSHPFFAERGGVGVVFENHFGAETLFDFIPHGVVVELRQVGRADDDPLIIEV